MMDTRRYPVPSPHIGYEVIEKAVSTTIPTRIANAYHFVHALRGLHPCLKRPPRRSDDLADLLLHKDRCSSQSKTYRGSSCPGLRQPTVYLPCISISLSLRTISPTPDSLSPPWVGL